MDTSNNTGMKPQLLHGRRLLFTFISFARLVGILVLSIALPLLAQGNPAETPEALPTTKVKRKVVIRSEPDKQSVGRQSLTGDQIKYAPATFGDSLNAFTTLPGVMRTDVLFGSLVIRGRGDNANRYFVDGIPIPRPQHFGGLHSVLNTDIVKEANIYASAAPARFGGITGAVLEFQTIDEVDEFGGVVDVGLLSANFLLKSPWSGGENRPGGYWITAARVGYLPLIVPPVYQWVTGEPILALPQYYDYQVKGKITLDAKADHQLTLLALGSYDIVSVQRTATGFERNFSSDLGFLRAGSVWEAMSHSVGLYYDYEPSRKLKNNLLIYNTLVMEKAKYNSLVEGQPRYARSSPHMAGFKENFSYAWLDGAARLNTGIEYTLYYYQMSSRLGLYNPSTGRESALLTDDLILQHVPSAFIENKFEFRAWKFVPGVRADVLPLSRYAAIGPRGLIGYEVHPGTWIEAAGGIYQSFAQVNPEYVDNYPYDFRDLTRNPGIEPEEAIHRSLAVLRKHDLWEIKLEGYWNSYYREIDPWSATDPGFRFMNTGYGRNLGAEFSIRKNPNTANEGLYGWASYTLGRSEEGRYLSKYDQTHNFKLVAGYLFGIHSLSARVDVYSGFPYTPIVGASYSPSNNSTYAVYGDTYSAHFPIAHRISLRYGQERKTTWGSWRWYVEVVNATNYAPIGYQNYNFSRPYEPGVNPTLEPLEPKIPILPNFGIEVRF